jgi:S1-C subfamily serine protease
MIVVDILVVVLALALAALGLRQGLIGSLPIALGLIGGALIGAWLGAMILSGEHASPYLPLIVLVLGLVLAVTGMLFLDPVAQAVRERVVVGPLALVDRFGGAIVLGAVGIAIAWILGLVALNTPELSGLRGPAQESKLLQELNSTFPPEEEPLRIESTFDEMPELEGPEPRAGAPRASSARTAPVRRAARGTVRVTGSSCGLNTAGSGWVVRPRLVVTAAHVVAGQEDTIIETASGRRFDTVPVRYDPRNDLAVLRIDGRLRALPESEEERRGTPGAVVGFDEDGNPLSRAARLGRFDSLPSLDSYGKGPTLRRMVSFRGAVGPGLSGAPLVDEKGRVMGTVFATLAQEGPPSALAIPNQVVRDALSQTDNRTDTGSCAG